MVYFLQWPHQRQLIRGDFAIYELKGGTKNFSRSAKHIFYRSYGPQFAGSLQVKRNIDTGSIEVRCFECFFYCGSAFSSRSMVSRHRFGRYTHRIFDGKYLPG